MPFPPSSETSRVFIGTFIPFSPMLPSLFNISEIKKKKSKQYMTKQECSVG